MPTVHREYRPSVRPQGPLMSPFRIPDVRRRALASRRRRTLRQFIPLVQGLERRQLLDADVWVSGGGFSVFQGQTALGSVSFGGGDSDGDPISVYVTEGPSHGSVSLDSSTGNFTY